MGMRGHVSVCPLRIKNTPFLLARSGPYPWVLTSPHTKWHFNRFGRFCMADAWWSSQQTSVTDSTDRRTTTLPVLWLCVRRGRKNIILQQLATTFCQGASSKSKLSVYCRYLSGRLWWGDVFRLESSSLRPHYSYIQTGIGSPTWCRVWCVI